MTTQRPILFSTEMVNAILSGEKTQTRRIMKQQIQVVSQNWLSINLGEKQGLLRQEQLIEQCPYGKVGDILWIRENYLKPPFITQKMKKDGADTWPKYDFVAGLLQSEIEQYKEWGWKVKPSIHMPKNICRLYLQIEKIRFEKLANITEEDALKEGINRYFSNFFSEERYHCYINKNQEWRNPSSCFKSLWQKINGADSWDKNPFVWVIEFKKIANPNKFFCANKSPDCKKQCDECNNLESQANRV